LARQQVEWTAEDIELFQHLGECFASEEQVLAVFEVSDKTLKRLVNKHLRDAVTPGSKTPITIRQALDHYRLRGQANLLRMQYDLALGGSVQMLTLLGQQELGQSNKKTVEKKTTITNEEAPIADIALHASKLKAPTKIQDSA
jgi:AraC-like DNA-binding protein